MANKEKFIERAQKHIQKGNLDKAIAEYQSASKIDTKDVSVKLRIGDLYVKTGRVPEAIKEYSDVARANSQQGFYLKSIAVYKQVLKLDESNLDVHYRLAELYTKQRLIADAIGEYSVIVASFDKKGKSNEALELLRKMVDIDAENVGVRLKLAENLQRQGFEVDAIAEYSTILEKLLGKEKLERAETIYVDLYNAFPGNVTVLEGLAEIFKRKGEEMQYLRFARALKSAHVEGGDLVRAREVSETILETRPDDVEALEFLGLDAESAVEESAAQESPDPADFSVTKSVVVEPATGEPGTGGVEYELELEVEAEVDIPVEVTQPAAELEPEKEPEADFEEEVEFEIAGLDSNEEETPLVAAEKEEVVSADTDTEQELEVEFEIPAEEEPQIEEPQIEEPVPASEIPVVAEPPIELEEEVELVEATEEVEAAEVEAEPATVEEPRIKEPEAASEIPVVEEPPVELEKEVELVEATKEVEAVEVEAEPATVEEPEVEEFRLEELEIEEVKVEATPGVVVTEELPVVEEEVELVEAIEDVEAAEAEAEPATVEEPEVEEFRLEELEIEEVKVEATPEVVVTEELPVVEEEVELVEAIEEVEAAEVEAEPETVEEPEVEEFRLEELEIEEVKVEATPEVVVTEELPVVEEEAELVEAIEEVEATEIETVEPRLSEELDAELEEEFELFDAKDEIELPITDEQDVEVNEPAETDDLAEQAISEAIDELMDKIEPAPPVDEELGTSIEKVADDSVEEREEEYVDLSAELGLGGGDKGSAVESAPTAVRASETSDEFRTGLEDQLRREDTETHYNLGIAYMEMELYKEASKEFKVALKDPNLQLDCYSRLGMSAMAESNAQEAITYFKLALKIGEAWSEDERKGCKYELALAYEAAQDRGEAAALFADIHAIDSDYREVSRKVAEYGGVRQAVIPIADDLIEVEFL